MVVVDARLRPNYMNPAAETLFGTSARALAERPAESWLAAPLRERISTSLADGQRWTARELPLASTGLQPVTVDVAVSPLAEDRAVLEFSGVDRYLRISRDEQLKNQHAAAQALVRGLAHEIKNPLGGLRGAAQLLQRRLDDPALHEYTQVIIAEADRLGALVDALLGPTRAPAHDAVNIHEVTERVATLLAADAPPGMTLRRDYDPSLPVLHGDRDQLMQALLNLARNAAQAAPGGTVTLRTRVERQATLGGRRHRQALCVEVIDDGPGVPPEQRERIFLPLVTTRADGSGLGLSIAQSLVARHGGVIECDSEPGRTVFTMLLPLDPSDG